MTQVTFGEKSWDEDSAGMGGGGSTDFLNMKEPGQYVVRILGKPYEFAVHWLKIDNVNRKATCAGRNCFLCKTGKKELKASVRYLIPVLSRKDNTCKITEFGTQVYGHIQSLYKTSGWGDPRSYDISIVRGKNGTAPAKMYFVTPMSKEALSDSEKDMVKEFLTRIDLQKMSAPMENDEIAEKIGPQLAVRLGWKPAASANIHTLGGGTATTEVTPYNFEKNDDLPF